MEAVSSSLSAMPPSPPHSTEDIALPLDYSEPLSSLLKVATSRAHDSIQNSKGAAAIVSGKLPLGEYLRYQFMLWNVYNALETALDQHSNHPTLAPTYNPRLLARSEALSSDIASYLQTSTDPAEWQAHSSYQSFLPLPNGIARYVARIQEIASSSDPTPLLAHSYVRYLGDLSGGQFMKRILGKVYGSDGPGLTFYDFGKLDGNSSGHANIGDMRKIKDWFKAGIDAGVPTDMAAKNKVIEEAHLAYELNNGLFDALVIPSDAPNPQLTNNLQSMTPESKVVYTAPTNEPTSLSLAVPKFVTLLLAMSAAHLLLTVGGFTGASGGEKLERLLEAVDGYVQLGAKALGW